MTSPRTLRSLGGLTRLAGALALMGLLPSLAAAQDSFEYRKSVPRLAVSSTAAPSSPPAQPAPSQPTPAPAPAPTLRAALSTNALAFESTTVGQSRVKQVAFTNQGTGSLSLQAPAVTGAAFQASTNCGASLPPGQSCEATVTFSPSTPGSHTGSLRFDSNAVESPLTVSLSGEALQAQGSLTADSSTSFGTVKLGNTASRSFTFTNTGSAPAENVFAALTGSGLTLASNSCGTSGARVTLAPQATCSMTVQYAPTAEGALTGSLSVTSTAGNSPSSLALQGLASGDAQWANVKLMAPFDGAQGSTSLANTAGGFTLTNANAGSIAAGISAYGSSGSSYYTNSNGSAIANGTVALGSANFTVEGWVNFKRALFYYHGGGGYSAALLGTASGTLGSLEVIFYAPTATAPTRLCAAAAGGGAGFACANYNFALNTWHHVAVTRNGATLTLYINGQSSATGNAGTAAYATTAPRIGTQNIANYYGYFDGYIDDFRITTGVARYSGNFTPPTAPLPAQ